MIKRKKLALQKIYRTYLPGPFPERATNTTDNSRFREHSSSAHCKNKHRRI